MVVKYGTTTTSLSIIIIIGYVIGSKLLLEEEKKCTDPCRIRIVESIPEGLVYNSSIRHMATYEAWLELFDLVEGKLELASSYWSLRGSDVHEHPSDREGEDIFEKFVNASRNGIEIYITQNLERNSDTEDLGRLDKISVRSLNFSALMGAGILHTKLWIADRKHFYVGSANFDWRSLTQVKEMGILVTDCPCLAEDMAKIFEVYWMLGGEGKSIPDKWPERLATRINLENPIEVRNVLDDSDNRIYLTSSPPPFCPRGRTTDIDAIIKIIDEAEEFIYIAVMDYFPSFIYTKKRIFWPIIDNALRRAAIDRGVEVRLLLSHWPHTRTSMIRYLRSLVDLSDGSAVRIEGKMFKVPSFTPDQAKIPFARVNHNKYMITDKTGFIGTSNWSGDYFVNTGGIGFVFQTEKKNLRDVFLRDWNSVYAHNL